MAYEKDEKMHVFWMENVKISEGRSNWREVDLTEEVWSRFLQNRRV